MMLGIIIIGYHHSVYQVTYNIHHCLDQVTYNICHSVYEVTYNIYLRNIYLVPEPDVRHHLVVYSVATFNVSSD